MSKTQIIQADRTWTGDRFETDIRIVVGADGTIERVGPSDQRPVLRLYDRAIIPGMINAHSHAFQRGLRGRGETFPQGAGSFWTWREAMYALVDRMAADRIYALSHQAFVEMLKAGITTVGEFHYLHHDNTCEGYRFDEIVLTAAHDAGIRIVLLNAFYNTGGINAPLSAPQRRFASGSCDDYWRQFDRLAAKLHDDTQTLGVVAHSIRAAGLDDIVALHRQARERDLVFHMHVEEQRREIEESVAAYGKAPMALLNHRLSIDNAFTAVHCTHTAADDMNRFAASGGNVCLCPLTEANLGDGLADIAGIRTAGGHLCVGTDSNARIDMTEELRWLEYGQRLKGERRGVLANADGSVSTALLEAATTGGARSLGLRAGSIEPGCVADFAAIDLTAPSLTGWTDDTLLDALVFGAGNDAIAAACVGGRWNRAPNAPAH